MGLFGFSDVFAYSNACAMMFARNMSDMGKEPKTTLFSDMSIAEWFGKNGIRDTFNRVMGEWLDNIEYITEFYIVLNHKNWQLYEHYPELAELYDELWRKCGNAIDEHYKDDEDALSYFYQETD